MKKLGCVVLIIILLFTLFSCNSKQTYVGQDIVNFNYNNISTGASPYWIDNEVVCFSEHSLVWNLYFVDSQGKHNFATISSSTDIQVYDDNIVYYDNIFPSVYVFKKYDLKTEKSKTIATLHEERIYEYYIVDDLLYVVIGDDDTLTKDIISILLSTGEKTTVAQNIFACGIVQEKLNYITVTDNEYSIYEYDPDGKQRSLLGGFELSDEIYEDESRFVNFSSEYITLVSIETDEASKIHVYRYANSSLKSFNFEGVIYTFVIYDKHAFLSAVEKDNDLSSTETIYCFKIDEQVIEKITELSGDIDLFVGSDDNVYVSSTDFDGVRLYSLDGNYKEIILK